MSSSTRIDPITAQATPQSSPIPFAFTNGEVAPSTFVEPISSSQASTTTLPDVFASSLPQDGESTLLFDEPTISPASGLLFSTPLTSSTSPTPSIATASLTSSVGTIHTPATITPSTRPDPPSGSAGLSGAAKVGTGLGIPFGILLCAAIIYFSMRYHRRRTLRGIRAVGLHTADTEEKNTKVQDRDDGVIRELY